MSKLVSRKKRVEKKETTRKGNYEKLSKVRRDRNFIYKSKNTNEIQINRNLSLGSFFSLSFFLKYDIWYN